jgi:hypothetical protein
MANDQQKCMLECQTPLPYRSEIMMKGVEARIAIKANATTRKTKMDLEKVT